MVTDRDLNLMAAAGLADDVRMAARGLYGESLSSPRDDVGRMVAELDRLRRERAELLDRIHGTPCAQIRWQQEREELQADNERLRAALRPFAEAADGFDMTRIKNPEEWFAYRGIVSSTESKGAITVGDLRRARAALDGQPAPGTEEA